MESVVLQVHRSSHNRPEQAQGVPGSLRPRIFLTFGTTRVVGRQPYAPAAFTPEEITGFHFQRLRRPQGTWFRRSHGKKSPATPPGIDPGTVRLVAQCLNHYATPLRVHRVFLFDSILQVPHSHTDLPSTE
jgi:hypothetical protein